MKSRSRWRYGVRFVATILSAAVFVVGLVATTMPPKNLTKVPSCPNTNAVVRVPPGETQVLVLQPSVSRCIFVQSWGIDVSSSSTSARVVLHDPAGGTWRRREAGPTRTQLHLFLLNAMERCGRSRGTAVALRLSVPSSATRPVTYRVETSLHTSQHEPVEGMCVFESERERPAAIAGRAVAHDEQRHPPPGALPQPQCILLHFPARFAPNYRRK